MKKLLLIALLTLTPLPAFAQYTQTSQVHCSHDNNVEPTIENMTGYINTSTSSGYGAYTDTWMEVDVTSLGVPTDAKWIWVHGRLLITLGSTTQSPNMTVLFAKPSSTVNTTKYQLQAIANNAVGGVRQTFATMIPLENGKYKYRWSVNGGLDPWSYRNPSYAVYGMNMTIDCWGK